MNSPSLRRTRRLKTADVSYLRKNCGAHQRYLFLKGSSRVTASLLLQYCEVDRNGNRVDALKMFRERVKQSVNHVPGKDPYLIFKTACLDWVSETGEMRVAFPTALHTDG